MSVKFCFEIQFSFIKKINKNFCKKKEATVACVWNRKMKENKANCLIYSRKKKNKINKYFDNIFFSSFVCHSSTFSDSTTRVLSKIHQLIKTLKLMTS